jgi:sensor histidine kinase YesM
MNIINIMARQGRDGEIIEVNSALIKILRDRLSSKLSILCTIAQEVDSLYQYQLIMRYRYENKVEVVVDVDSTLMEKKIPKNILQPLAENAFYHGFANLPDDQEGLITILIYSIEENIIIELSDNGAGISEERLKILQNHSYQIYADHKPHIGLDNIQQRLDYIYHGDYQFEIQSTLGYGTTIVITVPINPPNAEFEN